MINMNKQHGYILLPVVIMLTLVATVAFTINHESALDSGITSSQLEAERAEAVAMAGINHALWQAGQQGCGPYTDLTNKALANDSYTTTLTTDLGSTAAYTVNVDQDSWIRSDFPVQTHPVDSKLHVRFETGIVERPLLRFELSAIPAKSNILSATAWFYVNKEHPEGPVDIHLANADWTEAAASWDTMGASMDSAVHASIPSQTSAGVWVPVNLTSLVQAWVNGLPNYGITLNSTSEGTHGEYASRESANDPYLEVIVGTPPSSPAKLKSMATLASGISRDITRNNTVLYQSPPGSLILQPDAAEGKDAWLTGDKTTWNYGAFDWLRVRAGGGGHWRSSIQFDLAVVPKGAHVLSATLEIYRVYTSQDAPGVINVHAISKSWEEGSNNGGSGSGVSWNARDTGLPWNNPGGDYDTSPSATVHIDASTDTWFEIDVTSQVRQWVEGNRVNNGMMLVAGDDSVRAEFSSSDEANPTLRPKLTIR